MTVRIIQGDVRVELPKLPADYFDCIVTSPPYFGLRDYGTATWEGGDPWCDHFEKISARNDVTDERLAERAAQYGTGIGPGSKVSGVQFRDICGKCGARRIDAQIGLEPTLDAYLETMVAVCRQLRRVLKPSGVFFLNCGDSYTQPSSGRTSTDRPKNNVLDGTTFITRKIPAGLKPKDLCLVPERLGIALQADGWWVRSHIIWAKPNPMPESVTDRPTSAHETIWMLTKSARYFWDGEAVKEEAKDWSTGGPGGGIKKTFHYGQNNGGNGGLSQLAAKYKSDEQPHSRNMRNVWTDLWSIPSHPFPGAHFATFPPALVERCIKAGSSERGCCPMCGAPWVRVVERGDAEQGKRSGNYQRDSGARKDVDRHQSTGRAETSGFPQRNVTATCWQPSCKCRISGLIDCMPYTPVPARILDPFAGAGTTGLVSDRLGRDATLIDLNTSYIDMAVNRIRDDAPLFAEVAAE